MLITSNVNEAVNGFLFIMLLFSAWYFAFYLLRAWRERESAIRFYNYENKTALALFTLSLGLASKEGTEWWWFHLRNNGNAIDYPILLPLFLLGTAVAGWGLICLLRSLTYYEWSQWTWFWLTVVAVSFSLGFAV